MNNLFSLTYRPGFQRDGTPFQSKYCTDGNWVRFQRGRIKKMGGLKGVYSQIAGVNSLGYISSMMVIPFNEDVVVILGTTTSLYTYQLTKNWEFVRTSSFAITAVSAARTVQSILIDNKTAQSQSILWMATNNLLNINDSTGGVTFYTKEVDKLLALVTEDPHADPAVTLRGVDPRSNGGMCFVSDRLFLYGTNGFVQWSKIDDPLDFRTEGDSDAGGQRLPTTSKIVYAASTRGGSTGTSILFWSLSSVIRGTNTGGANFELSTDVVSSSSSIMSSRSVVEYDGLFFWAGVDRFFVYNGIVSELPNSLNLNYFFDNVDLNQREKVFGLKNTKYGEIAWFYCDLRDESTTPTRAIIYNKRENSWYDVRISRMAGYFSDSLGFMTSVGIALVSNDSNNHLWLHEQGSVQSWTPNGGAAANHLIPSFFVTPTISWAAFPPGGGEQPSQLLDRFLTLQRIEPDFVTDNNAPISMTITATTKLYAQSLPIQKVITDKDGNNPILIGGAAADVINFNIEARNISFTFASSQNFEVGNIHFLFGIGAAQ